MLAQRNPRMKTGRARRPVGCGVRGDRAARGAPYSFASLRSASARSVCSQEKAVQVTDLPLAPSV